ncbi:hypothetical protein GCM10029976_094350 [Kribbella albertanoniae]|uniref:Uncharacterized protein n=1 Tax=Kribbella albertanoniae TaxID=1266829 RepID=A0A4R4QG65_9ACTN|nr:hypothetical protein [Kribbella albertanoniae]TDC34666.1 hypothetical protein E1261_03325 [Kribbella albertanoniae]
MTSQEISGSPTDGPATKLSQRQRITNATAVIVILLVIGGVLYLARNNAANAEVGDCVRASGSNGLEQVDCNDPQAEFKVVGRVADKPREDATLSTCGAFKDVAQVYWEGTSNKGFVLCLANVGD